MEVEFDQVSAMTRVAAVLGRSLAATLPLALLALGLLFVAVIAVLRPTAEWQAMVGHLGRAMKDLGSVNTSDSDARPID
jgi:hypothetical protein